MSVLKIARDPILEQGISHFPWSLEQRPFDTSAAAWASHEKQKGTPYSVAILDVSAGVEGLAIAILEALCKADSHLHILVLLAGELSISECLRLEFERGDRLAILRRPCDMEVFFQLMKMMGGKWLRERQIESLNERLAAVSEPDSKVSRGTQDEKGDRHDLISSLASGIAHEYDSVFTGIQSHLDMVQQQAGSLPEVAELLKRVMASARKASDLSRKLTALASEEAGHPVAIDLSSLLEDEIEMLSKTLGGNMTLKMDRSPDLPAVWADPSVVSQIIANVAVHARAAMPLGGVLQFSTAAADVHAGGKIARVFGNAKQGAYVMLTVEDPNPTDSPQEPPPMGGKPADAASGRLLWVRETIEKGGGAFNVTLIPGMVRVYQLLFPVSTERQGPTPMPMAAAPLPSAMSKTTPATILVVDDDEMIRLVICQVLGTVKHRVLTASSADEGWKVWRQHRDTIKLVITDINMPGGADGVALAQVVQEDDASVPVIYTSGYRAVSQFGHLKDGINYLSKPFGMADLMKVVERNLALCK